MPLVPCMSIQGPLLCSRSTALSALVLVGVQRSLSSNLLFPPRRSTVFAGRILPLQVGSVWIWLLLTSFICRLASLPFFVVQSLFPVSFLSAPPPPVSPFPSALFLSPAHPLILSLSLSSSHPLSLFFFLPAFHFRVSSPECGVSNQALHACLSVTRLPPAPGREGERGEDRKSTRLNLSYWNKSSMPSSA